MLGKLVRVSRPVTQLVEHLRPQGVLHAAEHIKPSSVLEEMEHVPHPSSGVAREAASAARPPKFVEVKPTWGAEQVGKGGRQIIEGTAKAAMTVTSAFAIKHLVDQFGSSLKGVMAAPFQGLTHLKDEAKDEVLDLMHKFGSVNPLSGSHSIFGAVNSAITIVTIGGSVYVGYEVYRMFR